MALSLDELVHYLGLRYVNKTGGFLHGIYAKEISKVIDNEYGLNCPQMVSLVISQFANDNHSLNTIIRDLTYNHYYDTFFGFRSTNYRKLRTFHAISNGLIATGYIAATTQFYSLQPNLIVILLSYSYLVPIFVSKYYHHIIRKLLNKVKTIQRCIQYYPYSKIYNRNNDNKHIDNIKKLTKYYKNVYNVLPEYTTHYCTDYVKFRYIYWIETLCTYSLNTRYIISLIISYVTNVPAYITLLNTLIYILMHLGLVDHIHWSMTQKRKEPIYLANQYICTRLIMDQHSSNILPILIYKFVLNIASMKFLLDKRDLNPMELTDLYFCGRIFSGCYLLSTFITNMIPSFYIHFEWNIPLNTGLKILSIILYGTAYFAQIGHSYYAPHTNIAIKGREPVISPDIFGWTYLFVKYVHKKCRNCSRKYLSW